MNLPECRFNEAPIHESGKSEGGEYVKVASARASMRPRFMNRGSRRCPPRVTTTSGSFNEAPIHESGKFDFRYKNGSAIVMLQ